MRLTEKNRRYILLGMVAFIIIGIFTAKILGSKQDEQFMYEDRLYAQANQLYEQGNYVDALSFSNELLELQPKSEAANYLGGLIAASVGEYNQAAILLQKTLDLNPYKVEDPLFLLYYAEVLYNLERYADAKIILTKCYEWAWKMKSTPEFAEQMYKLIGQTDKKLYGKE